METTKTLREIFRHLWYEKSQHCEQQHLTADTIGIILEILEQEIKLAEERGRQEAKTKDLDLISEDFEERHRLLEDWRKEWEAHMKQRVQNLLDEWDDYVIFEEHFKQL